MLKLVQGRISPSRETYTRKQFGRVDGTQRKKHIIIFFLMEFLHPPALARAEAIVKHSFNSFWILGER